MSGPVDDDATLATSELRHYLRNRLAAIRNAAFYIQRQADGTGLMEKDPRVERFFDLIRTEVLEAEDALTKRLTPEHLLGKKGNR